MLKSQRTQPKERRQLHRQHMRSVQLGLSLRFSQFHPVNKNNGVAAFGFGALQ